MIELVPVEQQLKRLQMFFPEFTWKPFQAEFPSHVIEGVEAQLECGHIISVWRDRYYVAELHDMNGPCFRIECVTEVGSIGNLLDAIHKKHKAADRSGVLKNYVPWSGRVEHLKKLEADKNVSDG